jgi:hypothetical protein
MNRILVFLSIIGLAFGSVGCATAIDLGQSACEALVGGSKAGKICTEIGKLRKDIDEIEAELAEDAPATE